jgi:hypothetical protein
MIIENEREKQLRIMRFPDLTNRKVYDDITESYDEDPEENIKKRMRHFDPQKQSMILCGNLNSCAWKKKHDESLYQRSITIILSLTIR